ncbi:MAG: ADP-ribosylglycohydrolase family protein [Desulfobacterales bacterium]|jgi:ADP-ribosylglycohydrolase|nr:ADP-ribosylglycohydrolase family protein [Desulfobacterales bacterium]
MIGAIAGDMIGSPYESYPIKHTNFDLVVSAFTDDTVLTIAIAYAIINEADIASSLKKFAEKYHNLPYGSGFRRWIWSWDNKPYNSFGNGSAMRVSPVGFAYDSVEDVLHQAERTAGVTHNHPEGIKGAQATALAIYMARIGESRKAIRQEIADRFSYDLNRTVDEIRPNYSFDVTCQGSVPESIIAFLDSNSWEDAVKKSISLGGDADTMACITGGIAQAFYKKIPDNIAKDARNKLPGDLLEILDKFNTKYKCHF